MRNSRIALAVSVSILASALRASAGAPPDLKGPDIQQLAQMNAAGAQAAGGMLDGSLPRQEGPVTVIKEDPNWKNDIQTPSYTTCDYPPGYPDNDRYDDGYYRDGRYYHHYHEHRPSCVLVPHPGYTTHERGTWQLVKVNDRGAFTRESTRKGALWGGLMGAIALGVMAGLGGPVGAAIAVGVGIAALGTAIGYVSAATKSDTYDRVVNRSASITYP